MTQFDLPDEDRQDDDRSQFGVDGKCPVRDCGAELDIDGDVATCPAPECDHQEIRQHR